MTTSLLDRYSAALRARGLATRTIENYRFGLKVIEDHIGKPFTISLDHQLKAGDVWSLLEDRADDLSQAYLRQIVSSAKSWHKWGHSRELWPLNGILSIPSPNVPDSDPDPLSPSQVLWLLMNARDDVQRKLILLGGWVGTRISESAAMDETMWIDNDHFSFRGKGGKRREVPIPPALKGFREICTTPVSERRMRWAYESLRARSPFVWTPHQLRDTFTQRHLDRTVEVEVVEDMLGHKPRSTTLRVYGSVPWDRKLDAQRKHKVL